MTVQEGQRWFEAVRYGQAKTLQQMLKKGFNIDMKNEKGRTALMIATVLGDLKVLGYLLNARNKLAATCFKAGKRSKVRFVRRGCNVDIQDADGKAAIMFAFLTPHHFSVAKILIESGANLNIQDNDGFTPLMLYVKYCDVIFENYSKFLQMLIKHSDLDIESKRDGTVLVIASFRNNVVAVDSIIKHGCDLDRKDENGYTALSAAVINGHTNIVKKLMMSGAKSSFKHSLERTDPLMLAILNNNLEVFKLLLKGSLEQSILSCKDCQGENIFHKLAKHEKCEMLQVLIQAFNKLEIRSKINSLNHEKNTPLLLACHCQKKVIYWPTVQLLVQAGASIKEQVSLPCTKGSTKSCINILHHAAVIGDIDTLKCISSQNLAASINNACTVRDGKTSLMLASVLGHTEAVKIFVDMGCELNLRNIRKDSEMAAIHYGAVCGCTHTLQVLIEAGASIGPAKYNNVNNWDLIHFAARFGHKELTTYLVNQLDCDVNAKTDAGKTPIDLAMDHNHIEIVKVLVQAGATVVGTWWNWFRFKFNQYNRAAKRGRPMYTVERNSEIFDYVLDAKREEINGKRPRFAVPMQPADSIVSEPSSSLPSLPTTTLTIDQPYSMEGMIPGLAIIISNEYFSESSGMNNRYGTDVDMETAQETFTNLGYLVHSYCDLTADNMVACINHYCSLDLHKFGSLICVVLSHGKHGHIYGTDGKNIPVIKLTSKFKVLNCATMKNKPKAFVIVACQDDDADQITVQQSDLIPVKEEDFIVGYSTMPGLPSLRHQEHGTPYVHHLTRNLRKYGNIRSFERILENTNKHMKATLNCPCLLFSSLRRIFQVPHRTESSSSIVVPKFEPNVEQDTQLKLGIQETTSVESLAQPEESTDVKTLHYEESMDTLTISVCRVNNDEMEAQLK